jgi:ABC-type nitrate/sulfonate/bicarbonate transport system substrate-binding protein
MKSARILVGAILFCVRLFAFASVPFAQVPFTMNFGSLGMDTPELPAWLAKETGIYERNGLDLRLVYLVGGPTAVATLISGDTPITHVGGVAVVRSNLRGSDVVLIAAGTVRPDFWLMSRRDIKSPAQLKGGTIGIGRFGGINDFILDFLLPKLGLTPGKDVTIVQAGGVPDRLSGLETGRLQATLLSPPVSFVAQKKGFNLLADVVAMGMSFQHTSVASTRKFVREHPDIVRRYVKSQVESVHRLKTDRETGIRVLSKYMRGLQDRDILERAYDRAVADEMLPRKQYPTLDGVKTILAGLAKEEPKAKIAKAEEFAEMRFINELDQSGFIDSLYRR